jgi:isopenicillin-N N-acyltransferase like protein
MLPRKLISQPEPIAFMAKKRLPLIEVSGSNYEMGFQHGKECSDKIRKVIESRLWMINCTRALTLEQALSEANPYLPHIQSFAPHLVTEMQGIADGANVPLSHVLFVNIATELTRYGCGCSAFAISGRGTKSGQIIAGQNWDTYAPGIEECLIMLHTAPIGRPEALMFTYAGVLGYMGINSSGVSHFSNSLVSPDSRLGVSHYFLFREFLELQDVHACVQLVSRTEVASSENNVLTDGQGRILDMELTPGQYDLFEGDDGFIVHTNHFTSPKLKHLERFLPNIPDSPRRLERLRDLVEKDFGKIDVQTIKTMLCDHDGYPSSLCRHLMQEGPLPGIFKTSASLIAEPEKRTMHVALGNPCENEYYTYQL